MILPLLTILLISTSVDDSANPGGVIRGVVVNGSHSDEPIGDTDVLLRRPCRRFRASHQGEDRPEWEIRL